MQKQVLMTTTVTSTITKPIIHQKDCFERSSMCSTRWCGGRLRGSFIALAHPKTAFRRLKTKGKGEENDWDAGYFILQKRQVPEFIAFWLVSRGQHVSALDGLG